MLEYFSYKKFKKNQAAKSPKSSTKSTPATSPAVQSSSPATSPLAAPIEIHDHEEPSPVLNEDDENFLQRIVSEDEGPAPPLPARPSLNALADEPVAAGEEAEKKEGARTEVKKEEADAKHEKTETKDKGKGKAKETDGDKEQSKWAAVGNRLSILKYLPKKDAKPDDGLKPSVDVPEAEAEKEEDDIAAVLEQLNLAAVNNRAFSLSKESQELVQKFTLVLKDLVNGVPTAYDDLTQLLDKSNDQLSKTYESLPSSLKKLVASLPTKFTSSLAPELLAVATEAQALSPAQASAAGGSLSAAAKSFLRPTNLKDLVTRPGAVSGLLRSIMTALKTRWPAFLGTNVLLSLALFLLLFVFWYCHKRGREVRLSREQLVDENGNIIETDKLSVGDEKKSIRGESSGNISEVETPGDEVLLDPAQHQRLEAASEKKLDIPEVKVEDETLAKH